MPINLALSHLKALPFDFGEAVTAFIEAKKAHCFTVGEPAPAAPHAWVERAVKRVRGATGQPDDFVADYVIVDDSPPPMPPPTLEQRKQVLVNQAQANAMAAHTTIIPPLKARWWNLEFARIWSQVTATPTRDGETADQHRVRSLAIIAKNNPADVKFFNDYSARQKTMEAVQYHLAKLESDIHDLTDATIEAWKPAPFPGA